MPFSNFPRTDSRPRGASEPSFAFLQRSARAEISVVRSFISDALTRYPESEREELSTRLRYGNETAFRSATFELMLHEVLLRMGHTLTPHPDPGTGSTKRPDFLVTAADGLQFILEAVLASERDGSSAAAEAMKASTLDRLDATPHHSFHIEVSSEGDPTTQPSGNALRADVHRWLNTLDHTTLRAQLEAGGILDLMPLMQWQHEEWQLEFRALPMPPQRLGRAQRLIGLHGAEARWVNLWEPLRDAVKKKGNRYGPLPLPYIVAVNADAAHLDTIDEVQALYGEEYWSEHLTQPTLSGPRRRPNGAWQGPHGAQYRAVSAVWFLHNLTPYTLAHCPSTLYLNPWATRPLPPAPLRGVPLCHAIGDRLQHEPGRDLASFLGLPAGWPEVR